VSDFAGGVLSVGAKMQRLNKALKSNRDRGITHQSLVKRMSELISLREKVAQAELVAGILRLEKGEPPQPSRTH
jgi:hypothetical protein